MLDLPHIAYKQNNIFIPNSKEKNIPSKKNPWPRWARDLSSLLVTWSVPKWGDLSFFYLSRVIFLIDSKSPALMR